MLHDTTRSGHGTSTAEALLRRQRARHLGDLAIVDAIRALFRRWWIVAGVTGVFVIFGVGATMMLKPSYVATGFLVVDSRRSSIPEIGVVSVQAADPRIPRSEGKVLTAPEFQVALVERLNLPALPFIVEEADKNPPKRVRGVSMNLSGGAAPPENDRDAARRTLAREWLADHLQVSGEDRSYAIVVAMESPDPALSAEIVNGAMKLYLERRAADDAEVVQRASASIAQRHDEIRKDVENLERQILARRTELDLVSTNAGRIETLDLVKLTGELRDNQEKQARLRDGIARAEAAAATGRWQDIDTALSSPYLNTLLEQEALAARDRASISSNFGANHPDVARLNLALETFHQRLRAEVARISASLKAEVAALAAREADVKAQIAAGQSASADAAEKEERITQLDDELKSKRELLATYDTRLQQLAASISAAAGAVRVGAWAAPPIRPSGPSPLILVGIAGFVGFVAGSVYVVLERRFGDRLESTDEIVAVAGLPVIGAVPYVKPSDRNGRPIWAKVATEPHGAVAESVRAMLVRLQFTLKSPKGVVLVTSALAGDGKTSIALAVAQQAAVSGKRTLLIDADLFRAGATRAVGIDRPLASDSGESKPFIVEDVQTRLHILAAPRIYSSSQQNQALRTIGELVQDAKGRYDLIILDTPPVMHVSDATLLAPLADAVVLVASWQRTSRSTLIESLERIEPAGRPIAGIALSKVRNGADRRYVYGGYAEALTRTPVRKVSNIAAVKAHA